MDINQLNGRKAYKILNEYDGMNPYILAIKDELGRKKDKLLTTTQNQYILKNHAREPKFMDKVVEINEYLGVEIMKSDRLDFIPQRIKIECLLGETDKAYHVIAKVSSKAKSKIYFLSKNNVYDDLNFELLPVNIDFDKYNERLIERRGYELLPHQKEAVNFLLARNGAILADEMGVAKASVLTEKIYTPNGYKLMGDIKVGDEVIGSNGKVTNVVGVFPQGIKPIYRVTFNDGYHLDVCKDHLWEVSSTNNGYNQNNRNIKKYVLDVNQMLNENGFIEEKHVNGRTYKINTFFKKTNGDSKWQIPVVKPIEFNINEELPIDPYLLGLSLGDGHFIKNTNSVKIKLLKEDYDEIIKPFNFNILTGTESCHIGSINLGQSLTNMGLNGTRSHNKFIPAKYKYTTIENRIAIMQGLMDTDGCCVLSDKGAFKGAEYTSVSEQLVDDLAEIVHTLGGIVRKTKGQGKYVKDGVEVICKEYYKLNIKFNDINPFRLKRKADKFKFPTKYKVGRYIKNIEYIGDEEAQCIRVDADDHLYVSTYAIVTHNTLPTIVAALQTKFKRILVVCPSSVKINWEREINTFSDNTSIVEGRIWTQARFTIINYDILQNFHTLESKIDPNDPPTYISRELVNANFDLIIVDEAHNLRNKNSIRGEIVSELCNKFGNPKVWLLSGTPVANRPKDFYNLLKLIRCNVADDYKFYMQRYCEGRQISKKLANGKTKKIWITNGASNLDELAQRTKHLLIRRLKVNVVDMPQKQIIRQYQKLNESSRKEYESVWEEYLQKRKDEKKKGNIDRELVELGLLRKFVAMEAIPSTYELAMEAIEQDKKVIIFTTFNDEQDQLAEMFGNIAVCHNGRMSINDKQFSVDAFQTNDNVKVFIGNIISAGVGITLTAGSVSIFNSYSWIPGDNDQAEDRSWRIGQVNDCKVYYQVFIDTISEKVLETLSAKRDMINQIIADEEEVKIMSERIMDLII